MNDRFRNERNRRGQSGWQGQGPDERFGWEGGDERSGWSRGGDERSGWSRGGDERSGWSRGGEERSQWGRGREDEERGWRAQSTGPQYSSDWDETYGSEWQRGRGEGQGQGQRGGYGQGGSYGQTGSQREHGGWYSHGNAGMYGGMGGGLGGGYVGGRGSGGYGGSTGTDYGAGSYGGGSYGGSGREPGFGRERGFGGARDQGYRGRDIGSPGADLRGGFAGRGPKGYTRTDDRIREDVCDRLSMDDDVDASEIEVRVENGEVTLVGAVQTRSMKHQAEDVAEAVPGVTDVHNQLRVVKSMLNELKDKLTGSESERHYANSGTRDKPANGTLTGSTGSNGTL
jgi:hypothetical protein